MRIIGNDPSTPRQAQIVASGTLPSGKPVVVNSDGTVSVVAESGSPEAIGTQTALPASGTINYIGLAFDSNANKVVASYRDHANSNYGTAVVGTVSGTGITWGTPVVFKSSRCEFQSAAFDSNSNKIVIAYRDEAGSDLDYGEAVVGTVSGTSISFGSTARFNSGRTTRTSIDFDSNSNKFLISYIDQGNSFYGTCVVATVSGTSISFGPETVYASVNSNYPTTTFDSNSNKFLITNSTGSAGVAYVATISGTSVSFGSPVTFNSSGSNYIGATFDSISNKIVIAFSDSATSPTSGAAIVGTISGTSVSFGTKTTFRTGGVVELSAAFDSNAGKVVIGYKDYIPGSDYDYIGQLIVGTVSGTSISFPDDPTDFTQNYPNDIELVFDSNSNKIVTVFRNEDATAQGASIVYSVSTLSTNLTSENYIGMSGGAISVDSRGEEIGSASVFESAVTLTYPQGVTFDSNSNKVVISYVDNGNGNYGTAIVGTVSNNSISFGSPTVFEAGITGKPASVFDSTNNKVIVCYDDGGNSDYLTAVVGTVSGTSISFGTPVVAHAAAIDYNSITYDTNSQKVVIAYQNRDNSNYGTAVVGTVSGTSISFGTPVVFESASSYFVTTAYDSNSQKVVIAYQDSGNSSKGTAIVGTVSGTSISFGSAVIFEDANVDDTIMTYDPTSQKVVIAYTDIGNSSYATAIVGTVSGTGISFGSPTVFENADPIQMSISSSLVAKKVVVAYRDSGNSNYGTAISGTVSGTSISFDSPAVFESATTSFISSTYDETAEKVVIAYSDYGNSVYGTAVVFQTGYENITRGSVADGDNAAINLKGAVDENQVGLTAGQSYYVQTDGTLGTTPADPSVFAGTAVAATKLIVKG